MRVRLPDDAAEVDIPDFHGKSGRDARGPSAAAYLFTPLK
jgi:hypothetical protein